MTLVFLYGPPGVGKFTVGQALAAKTGFKLFDNHVSINAVLPFFAFGSSSFSRIVGTIRAQVLEEAAKTGLDLIFTLAYANPEDNEHVAKLTHLVEAHGGEVLPVRLWCTETALKERLPTPSRAERHKLTSLETLEQLLETYELFSDIPDRRSLVIDTTRHSPEAVAERIRSHYDLQRNQA